ncbi:MAG: hypothetical protein HOZ81_22895 [Streptomyces sp.]|nr:hypothetical protein [Streptomyces sp.]
MLRSLLAHSGPGRGVIRAWWPDHALKQRPTTADIARIVTVVGLTWSMVWSGLLAVLAAWISLARAHGKTLTAFPSRAYSTT